MRVFGEQAISDRLVGKTLFGHIRYNGRNLNVYLINIHGQTYVATVQHAFGQQQIGQIVNSVKNLEFLNMKIDKSNIFTDLGPRDADMASDNPMGDVFLCELPTRIGNVLRCMNGKTHLESGGTVYIVDFVSRKVNVGVIRHVLDLGIVVDMAVMSTFNCWSGSPCLIERDGQIYVIGHLVAGGKYIHEKQPNYVTLFCYSEILDKIPKNRQFPRT
jgi:hypothetical protein